AIHGYLDASQKAFSTMSGATEATRSGAQDLSRKAMEFAQENVSATFAYIGKLMHAKDIEDVLKVQTDFTKSQIQKLSEQTKALSEAAAKAATSAAKGRNS